MLAADAARHTASLVALGPLAAAVAILGGLTQREFREFGAAGSKTVG